MFLHISHTNWNLKSVLGLHCSSQDIQIKSKEKQAPFGETEQLLLCSVNKHVY